MGPGSLVRYLPDEFLPVEGVGLVLCATNDIEIPPTFEILWANGHKTLASQDDLELIEI